MNLSCLFGRHDVGPWELRPKLIGTRVPYLRWERSCRRQTFEPKPWRCRHVERRWFPVRIPVHFTPPKRPISVEDYLKRLRVTPPDPEALTTGPMPGDALERL